MSYISCCNEFAFNFITQRFLIDKILLTFCTVHYMWLLPWCFHSQLNMICIIRRWNNIISTKQQSDCWRKFSRSRWSGTCFHFVILIFFFFYNSEEHCPGPDELVNSCTLIMAKHFFNIVSPHIGPGSWPLFWTNFSFLGAWYGPLFSPVLVTLFSRTHTFYKFLHAPFIS